MAESGLRPRLLLLSMDGSLQVGQEAKEVRQEVRQEVKEMRQEVKEVSRR